MMLAPLASVFLVVASGSPAPKAVANPPLVMFENNDFAGQSREIRESTLNFLDINFNDTASSFRVRVGYRVTFFEDTDGKGAYFTYNCPRPIGNFIKVDTCDVNDIGSQITTGWLCAFRAWGSKGCQGWWNDRISGVRIDGPANPHQPQGNVDNG